MFYESLKLKLTEKEINSIKNIPQLKENENKLSKAYEVLGDFDHKKFLEGAKFAFETIINAFNNFAAIFFHK